MNRQMLIIQRECKMLIILFIFSRKCKIVPRCISLFVWKASYLKEAGEFIWKYQRGNKRQCRLNITFVRVLAPSIFIPFHLHNLPFYELCCNGKRLIDLRYAILSLVERTIPRTKDRSRVLKTILFLLISSWISITELLHKTCRLPDEVSFYLFSRLLILLLFPRYFFILKHLLYLLFS